MKSSSAHMICVLHLCFHRVTQNVVVHSIGWRETQKITHMVPLTSGVQRRYISLYLFRRQYRASAGVSNSSQWHGVIAKVPPCHYLCLRANPHEKPNRFTFQATFQQPQACLQPQVPSLQHLLGSNSVWSSPGRWLGGERWGLSRPTGECAR